MLTDLPVIIDGPGDYRTRRGHKVAIFQVSDGPETFKAKGAFYRMYRGDYRPRGFEAWHPNGRYRAYGESAEDIVSKWKDV